MAAVTELYSELKSLDEDYKKLHSNLIKAEANHDESEIINLLSQIHVVAKKQSKIKEALNGTKQNL